ncbi:MAG: glycosyltransferase [Thermoproteota archaeon]
MKVCLLAKCARLLPQFIKSFESVDFIDKVMFIGYTERQLTPILNKFIKESDYDYIIITADDVVFDKSVVERLVNDAGKFDVLTGYSRIRPSLNRYNITKTKLKGTFPSHSSYDWYYDRDLRKLIDNNILYGRTYFCGYSLSMFNRKLFDRVSYGFYDGGKFDGWATDFFVSKQLQDLGVEMFFRVDCYVHHLAWDRDYIIGRVEPHIKVEKVYK